MRIQKFIFCKYTEKNPLFLDEAICWLNFSLG